MESLIWLKNSALSARTTTIKHIFALINQTHPPLLQTIKVEPRAQLTTRMVRTTKIPPHLQQQTPRTTPTEQTLPIHLKMAQLTKPIIKVQPPRQTIKMEPQIQLIIRVQPLQQTIKMEPPIIQIQLSLQTPLILQTRLIQLIQQTQLINQILRAIKVQPIIQAIPPITRMAHPLPQIKARQLTLPTLLQIQMQQPIQTRL